MRIEILGPGCPKCRQLAENVEKAIEEIGIEAQVEKITNINEIANYGIMTTPGLVVDGEVKASGKLLSIEEIKAILKA
jgi:small redox-active disulfide protein 2